MAHLIDKDVLVAEIERLRQELQDKVETNDFIAGEVFIMNYFLSFIDSMQEECNITGIKSKHATGKLKECIDNITDESLTKARKQLEEEPKECMYSKDNYTDEDRKALCDGCEEECKFNKKEKPASEELEAVIDTYLDTYFGGEKEKQEWPFLKKMAVFFANWQKLKDSIPVSEDLEEAALLYYPKMSRISEPHGIIPADNKSHYLGDANEDNRKAFRAGANWQKQKDKKWLADNHKQIFNNGYEEGFEAGRDDMEEQLMAKAVDATVHIDVGGYPYIPQIELYDYDKDIPLAKEGDKYKVIVIKE